MIEKNIFQSWYTTDLPAPIQAKVDQYKAMNPDYTYHLYTDEMMETFVKEHFPGEIAECYHSLDIIVAKVDLWIYLVLYTYGGVYLDMDSSIERPLNELIKEDDQAVITAEGNPDLFVQWALIFSKGHPILKKTIDLVVDNIKHKRYPNDIHKTTGPTPYSNAIRQVHEELFKTSLDHANIKRDTDVIYASEPNVSYRIFGIDYCGYFRFKHDATHLLYANKKTWHQEQYEKVKAQPPMQVQHQPFKPLTLYYVEEFFTPKG
jgi:mannosyltransferase OCH1-like enzyme